MRLKSLLITFFVVVALLASENAEAQRRNQYQSRRSKNKQISHYRGGRVASSRFRPYSFVGASVNAMNYFGDLAPTSKALSTDISFTRPGFGLFYGYKFQHSMSVRVAFNYGRITGDDFTADPSSEADAPRYVRNLSFRNDIKELSATLQIDLLPNYGGPQSRLPINGYAFFGVAVFHHEPKGLVPDLEYQTDFNNPQKPDQAGEWVKLRELGTEGQNFGQGKEYSPFQFAIPFGVGGEVFLLPNISLGLEFGVRWLFFDHLDDVGGNYVDLDLFDDPLARIMSDRSLEAVSARSGETRDISLARARQPTFASGTQSYWASGYLGSGLGETEVGVSKRGDSAGGDIYLMTRIRVVYILGSGRAQFR
jgi:hypothetical protein